MTSIHGRAFSDFFVVGAQKAGTTALCSLLDTHPRVAISRPKEPMFFSRGDPGAHLHFFFQSYEEWRRFDWGQNGGQLLSSYADCFEHAGPNDLLGEGSTSYLHSATAPARIAKLNPRARIVISLRSPVDRAWSAYWHHLRIGHATSEFEQHLEFEGEDTLLIGEYERHLRGWLDVFPREQIHVLLFERFRSNPLEVMDGLAHFLGIEPRFDESRREQNRAVVPRSVRLQIALNRRARNRNAFTAAVGEPGSRIQAARGSLAASLGKTVASWNLVDREPPPMPRKIALRLEAYYRRANAGLSGLIDIDTEAVWYESGN